jgi:Mce-associated membrane protein
VSTPKDPSQPEGTEPESAESESAAPEPTPPPRAVFAATPSTILAGGPTPADPVIAPEQRSSRRVIGSGVRGAPAAVVAVVALAVAVAVVLAVVVSGLSGRTSGTASSTTTATVEKAATAGAQAALSYDYRHLSADFAAAEKFMTPSFKADYTSKTAHEVTAPAKKFHAVSVATVEAAGVGSISSSRATVLVFLDQTVRNSQLSAPRLDRSRVQVSLVHSGGKWLINNLSPI